MGVASPADRAPPAKTVTILGSAWAAKANLADRLHGLVSVKATRSSTARAARSTRVIVAKLARSADGAQTLTGTAASLPPVAVSPIA